MDLYTAMIRMIEELAKLKLPIVFKGAMVLSQILENDGTEMLRTTKDIDGNWVSEPPSMDELTFYVQKAASRVDKEYSVDAFREYGVGKSAGFKIKHLQNEKLDFSIDISIGENKGAIAYITGVNGVTYYASSPVKMAADKINSVSSRRVYRRAKDMLDLYQLTYVFGFNTYEIIKLTDGKLEQFNQFRLNYDNIKHAYDMLTVAQEKPDFDIVYERLNIFLEPFIEYGYDVENLDWNGESWTKK